MVYPDCGTIEIVVRDIDFPTKEGVSGQVIFIPASFGVETNSPQVAGKPFDLSVTSYNSQGEIAPNYQGPAELEIIPITPSNTVGGVLLPSTISSTTFSGGVAELQTSYNRWGTIQIGAHDQQYANQAGVSGEIKFRPSGLSFDVAYASEERHFFYTGEVINISLSVIDESNEVIPNYLGKVSLVSKLGLDLPAEYQFVESDEGTHAFNAVIDFSGIYTAEAQDIESGLKAQCPEIEVKEATLSVVSIVAPVGTAEVVVKLLDENGNIITFENDLDLMVELEEENPDGSASSSASLQAITFLNGIARILIRNAQAEVVTIIPKSTFKFKIKKGTVTFGKMAKTGIGTLMWREVKD